MSKLEEELLGAEFVASHELAEDMGVWIEFAERASRTAQDQFRVWVEDQQAFLQALSSGENPLEAMAEHARRSGEHCSQGVAEMSELYAEQTRRLMRVHEAFWQPLFKAWGSR